MEAWRIGDEDEPLYFQHVGFSAWQPIDAAGYPLAEILRDKNEQLDVDGHRRYLIAVNAGVPTEPEDLTAACAFIDFSQFPNIDRVYFEVSEGDFRLAYDQDAYVEMEARRLPSDAGGRQLVVQWIEVRMGAHWPSGLDLALRISWDHHTTGWLTPDGRELLEIEGHLFLQECGWETPRALGELHRGPLPVVKDMRRRIRPVR